MSDEAVQYLANAGFDPQYGARPLRRAIQRLLEDELSERLLAGEIEPGQRVRSDRVMPAPRGDGARGGGEAVGPFPQLRAECHYGGAAPPA